MLNTQRIPFITWLMWLVAAGFIAYMFMIQNAMSVMIPQLMKDFMIDAVGVGLISSSYFYSYTLCQMPAGMLLDWYPQRRVMTLAILIFVLGIIVFCTSTTSNMAMLGRTITGLGASAAVAGTLLVGLRYFPLAKFAMIAGASEMIGMFGGALGQIILAPSVLSMGWRPTLYVTAGMGIALAIITWVILKDRKPINTPPRGEHSLRHSIKCVLGISQMWWVGLFAALTFAPLSAFGGLWGVPYLQTLYDCSLSQAAIGSAMTFIGAGLGSPLIGYVSDGVGRRCLPMGIATFAAILTSLIIIYFPPENLIVMYVLIFLLGLFACAYVIPFALAKDIITPAAQGAAMGFTNMLCVIIGAPILQPLIGWLLQRQQLKTLDAAHVLFTLKDYHTGLAVIPITLGLALICLLFIKETHCQSIVSS